MAQEQWRLRQRRSPCLGCCFKDWFELRRYFIIIILGKVANSAIKSNLDANNVVVCNVHNGAHWVLATGYSGNNILVNDPGFSTTSYALTEIVDGQNAVYKVIAAEEPVNKLREIKNTARGIFSNLISALED